MLRTRAAPVASPETPNHSPKRNLTPGPAPGRDLVKLPRSRPVSPVYQETPYQSFNLFDLTWRTPRFKFANNLLTNRSSGCKSLDMVIVKANKNRREKDKAECCALCKTKTCRVCTLTTRQSHAKAKAKACPLTWAQSQVVALLIHFQLFKGKSGSPSPSRSRSHSVSLPPSRLPAHLPGDLGRPGFTWRFRLKTGAGLVQTIPPYHASVRPTSFL